MNILFFGLGGIGQRHLRIIKKLKPKSKIFAYRKSSYKFEIDDNLKKNSKINIIDKYSITTLSSDKDLNFKKFDLAIITNPTSEHLTTCIKMLKNNVPFFVEKPFSHNNSNFHTFMKLIKKSHLKFYVGYMMRFHPQTMLIHNLLNSKNTIGKVHSVTINANSFMPDWHKYENYKDLYASNKKLGGGILLTECHELDLMNFLFSKPQIIFKYSKKLSNYNINVEDNALSILKYKYLGKSFLCSFQSSFVQKTNYRNLVILSDKYFIKWDIFNSILEIKDYKRDLITKNTIPNFNRNIMFEKQMKFIFKDLEINNSKSKFFDLNILTHKTLVSLSNSKNL